MARKLSKNLVKARALVEPRPYLLVDAVPLLQKAKYAKFDETVDLTMRLGVDPKHADQMVRGTVVLPHGLGKSKIVAVIASGERSRTQRQPEPSSSAVKSWSRRSRRKIGLPSTPSSHPGHDEVRRPPR